MIRTLLLMTFMAAPALATDWQIDPKGSSLTFRVGYIGGLKLNAAFDTFSGTISLDPNRPITASADINVEASSIKTGLGFLNNLVRSDTYLDSATFPDMLFRLEKMERTSPSTADLIGEIEIRGITQPFELAATLRKWDKSSPDRMVLDLTGQIDRRDFGMVADLKTVDAVIPVEIEVELREIPR